MVVHNDSDIMPPPGRRRPAEDAKAAALRAAGALHPRPERVQDAAFAQHEFFDRRDHVQVKYEMLRRHRVDGRSVTAVAAAFGASRQTFYVTNAAFTTRGLPGLLPRPRGPQRAHKCTDAILDFVAQWRAEHETAAWPGVADAVRRRFHVTIHPRSLPRALARREKKQRPPGAARP
jgi:transposase